MTLFHGSCRQAAFTPKQVFGRPWNRSLWNLLMTRCFVVLDALHFSARKKLIFCSGEIYCSNSCSWSGIMKYISPVYASSRDPNRKNRMEKVLRFPLTFWILLTGLCSANLINSCCTYLVVIAAIKARLFQSYFEGWVHIFRLSAQLRLQNEAALHTRFRA